MTRRIALLWLVAFLAPAAACAQQDGAPNAMLLVAKPGLADHNFRETVLVVTQTRDGQTVGVILNRPGEPHHFGGPVMPQVLIALFRAPRPPGAAAFALLKGVWLTMHPENISRLPNSGQPYRLYAGFSGWAPGQLQGEMLRESWYMLPATEELLFRKDTSQMWRELIERARGERTSSRADILPQ